MKALRKFFRELFCRHDVGIAADWEPSEICLYVICSKCGKIYGHFHLPTIPEKSKEKLH